MGLSLKSLARLQYRQFRRGQKGGIAGFIILLVYFWLLEFVMFVLLKEKVSFTPLIAALACMSAIIPDFFLKLLFVRDRTVMDAFLKTRPVPQEQWIRFLLVSQCWNMANLMMPIALVPACFLFLPFVPGLVVFLALYAFSVFGGILVMLIKHRGPYQTEKAVSTAAVRSVRPDAIPPILGLQVKSLLRSKRLRTGMIWLSAFFLLEYVLMSIGSSNRLADFYLFGFFFMAAMNGPQFGLGIEAGFISAIWTRPIPIERILRNKFWVSGMISGLGLLICLPIGLWVGTPWYVPISYALFSFGFGALLMLLDAYNCVPFDLFGKTFFNYQGSKGTYKANTFIVMILVMGLGIALPRLLPDWLAHLVLAALGLLGVAFHRPFFRYVERKFLARKHDYLEKYLSI